MTQPLTLAITKIGDLLLENRITKNQNNKTIENIKLVIPEYQRPYKWSSKNANQLLDDIILARNENKEVYRVGTLILHTDDRNKKINYIVDGQQRTITFALLLKAMGETKIDFLKQRISNNQYSALNILNNYRGLERRIKNIKNEHERLELLSYIKNNCELIVVSTENISEAFQFFDSQNARGKNLYPHDLLKAYHLREMNDVNEDELERTVKTWEEMDQKLLANLFQEYLYRVKEWTKGNSSSELNVDNMEMFKGITNNDNYPYAKFYKGAYAYANYLNHSSIPFVTGVAEMNPFQLDTTIIAGKPFFEYAKHYFDVLADIQNNDKYEGYLINDNEIVKTLDLPKYKRGVGNRITRKLFDTAILLYVDRFCSKIPKKEEIELLNQFVVYAFIWSYSMRAQYINVGWQVAENYILGNSSKDATNAFNIYKTIAESDSPITLFNSLSDKIQPLEKIQIAAKLDEIDNKMQDGVFCNYLKHFEENGFLKGVNENE